MANHLRREGHRKPKPGTHKNPVNPVNPLNESVGTRRHRPRTRPVDWSTRHRQPIRSSRKRPDHHVLEIFLSFAFFFGPPNRFHSKVGPPFEGRGGGGILGVIRNNRNKVSIYITPFFSARNAPFLLSDVAFFFMAPAFFVCFFSVQQGNRSRLSIFLGGGPQIEKRSRTRLVFFFWPLWVVSKKETR